NNPRYQLRQMQQTNSTIVPGNGPATDPFTGLIIVPDQAWAAASIADAASHPWYTSVFGVTAQYGIGPDFRDEPMNNPLVMPTALRTDAGGANFVGDNSDGTTFLSGFRSMHTG